MEQVVIVITESAYEDLEDIENYISQDSQIIARRFISRIFDKIDQLKIHPKSGKTVPEINNPSVRELLINKYRIIYLLSDNSKINVIRIIHSSRLLDIEF